VLYSQHTVWLWKFVGLACSHWALYNFIPVRYILTCILASLLASCKLSQVLHMHMFGKHCYYTTEPVVVMFIGMHHCFMSFTNIIEYGNKKHAYWFCMGNWS
jgi:hypothetical protein